MRRVMDGADVDRAIRRLAHEILERNRGAEHVVLLGIPTRGVPLAERLGEVMAEIEGPAIAVGSLDIGLYRDDLDTRPKTRIGTTTVPGPIDGTTVVLVDDVLYTGRTIRAALDALVDLGRPQRVQLAVLVDRGHRELPIRPDYVGKNLPTSSSERVKVRLSGHDDEDGVWIETGAVA